MDLKIKGALIWGPIGKKKITPTFGQHLLEPQLACCNLLVLLHSCEVQPKLFQKQFETLKFEQSHSQYKTSKT
jgi:hypothetical protein